MKIMIAYNDLGMQETVFLVDDNGGQSQWSRSQFESEKDRVKGKRTALHISTEKSANSIDSLDALHTVELMGLGGITGMTIRDGLITNTIGVDFTDAENLIEGQEIDVVVFPNKPNQSKTYLFYTGDTRENAADLYRYYPYRVQQDENAIPYSLWWELSQDSLIDMKIAVKNLRVWNAMYCGQQAVEKALKALCVKNGIKVNKTHSLMNLAESANLITLITHEHLEKIIIEAGGSLSNLARGERTQKRVDTLRSNYPMWKLSKEQVEWLEALSLWNMEARYPERRLGLERICSQEFSEKWLRRVEALCRLLGEQIMQELAQED